MGHDAGAGLGVLQDAFAHLPGQVQPAAVLLQMIHYAKALLVMAKTARADRSQSFLSSVAEGRMAQVMPQRDSFGEILVEPERARDSSGQLRYFQGVCEASDVVIALRSNEDLRFVLQTTEGLGVEDAVPIPLVRRAHGTGLFRSFPTARETTTCSERSESLFVFLEVHAYVGQSHAGRFLRRRESRSKPLSVRACE